jgi:uncharacterized membrane protein YbhN (UPF0104 family)
MDPNVYMGANEKVTRRFKYEQVLGWLIVVAIFIYLGKMVWENWAQVKQASFTLRPFTLLLSTFIFAFSYFVQIWAWYLITLKLGIALSFSETLKSWFYSQLGKNLPGKVWLLLGRFYFYESKGKSKKAISVALFIETATVLISAGLLCLVGLFVLKEVRSFYFGGKLGWLVLLFFFACASLHPWILQKITNWILKLFKKDPLSLSVAYADILWILWISFLSWVLGGIGFFFFVASVFSVSLSHILFLAAALAIASILGLGAVFAPSGLGVREGVLVYLLSYVMPGSVAVIVSVLTRIWTTLIEAGLIVGIYFLFGMRKDKGGKGDSQAQQG